MFLLLDPLTPLLRIYFLFFCLSRTLFLKNRPSIPLSPAPVKGSFPNTLPQTNEIISQGDSHVTAFLTRSGFPGAQGQQPAGARSGMVHSSTNPSARDSERPAQNFSWKNNPPKERL